MNSKNISVTLSEDSNAGSCSQCSVDDPTTLLFRVYDGFRGYGQVMPVCFQCWNPDSPGIMKVFERNSITEQLRQFARVHQSSTNEQPIFNNWASLSCFYRFKILHKIFQRNSRFSLNMRDIEQYTPCRQENCRTCLNPQYCSYLGCIHPDENPDICTNNCSLTVHRQCQDLHQSQCTSSQPSTELLCQECNSTSNPIILNPSNRSNSRNPRRVTRSSIRGNTRTFASSIRQSSSTTLRPIASDSEIRSGKCCNCHRDNSHTDLFTTPVSSSDLKKRNTKSFRFLSKSRSNEKTHHLCDQCYENCVNGSTEWKDAWPGFFWDLLSGKPYQQSASSSYFSSSAHIHQIIDPELIWQIVPDSMRPWWINAIIQIEYPGPFRPYQNCTLQYPPVCFVDKTDHLALFKNNLSSGKFGDLRDAANSEDIMNANVLCPFGCTEHPRKSGHAHLDIIIQLLLRSCPIHLFHSHGKLRHFQSMWQQYFRPDGDYDSIGGNLSDWIIQPSIVFDTEGSPVVLTCRHHSRGSDKHWLYIPRQPQHTLPSSSTDQLCHAVTIPRNTKPTQRKKFNTSYSMTTTNCHFSGVDSFSLTQTSKWQTSSIIRDERELLALHARSDINLLLQQKVESHQLSQEIADSMIINSRLRYPAVDSITKYTDGATYVPASTACKIHLSNAEDSDGDSHFIFTINARGDETSIPRSWPRHINIVQMEDSSGYGITPRHIGPIEGPDLPSMTTWALVSSVSSISELYSILADKPAHYHVNGWDGHLLAYLSKNVLQNNPVWQPRNTPFKKSISNKDLVNYVMSRYNAPSLEAEDSCRTHFQFDSQHITRLFHEFENIKVLSSFEDIDINDSSSYDDVSIIIIATEVTEDSSLLDHFKNHIKFRRDDVSFTSRSVICFHAEENMYNQNPNAFHSISFYRNRMCPRWFKQERKDRLYTKCHDDSDPFHMINSVHNNDDYFPLFMVYVRDQDRIADDHRDKFIQSMGGKSHVKCGCNNFPLLPSPRNRQHRLSCMKCHRKESVTCSNLSCPVRLCSTCFKAYSTDAENIIDPQDVPINYPHQANSNIISQSDDDSDNSTHDDIRDDQSISSSDSTDVESVFNEFEPNADKDAVVNDEDNYDLPDDATVSSIGSLMTPTPLNFDDISAFDPAKRQRERDKRLNQRDTTAFHPDDVITHANQDFTLDTPNEFHPDSTMPFHATSSGDTLLEVEDMPNMDCVSGHVHVIMNQVSSCTIRSNKRISGTHRDKFFVQNLCSSTPGKIVPLVYPEAMMFPSIFYAESKQDPQSILGATPLWAVSQGCTKFGFPDPSETTRSRITSTGLAQTDKYYRRYLHNVHGNILLSKGDSRKILEKGFTVDNSSRNRLAINNDYGQGDDESGDNDDNGNNIHEEIDSPNMVLGLSESQKYYHWDFFGTATPNQSRTPGLKHITEWKRGKKWLEKLPDYKHFSEEYLRELSQSMEEATGPVLFRNWIETRSIFLEHLLKKVSGYGGKCEVFFSRDEYQANSGNLPHMHFVIVVDRTNMPPNAEEILMDAIRGSPWDIAKPEDVETLINEGLVQHVDEIPEIAPLAETLLKHVHDSRCYRRTGDGDGEESLKCRKMHSLHDTPDPTSHQHIEIPVHFQPEFNSLMERLGMCNVDSSGDYKYDHPFFKPQRHMPPCMSNDHTNMSPVDTYWWLFFESMVNVQYIGSVSTLAKYLMKYICKFDKTERIETKANAHTGALQVGSQFLHNTKISSSAYHERKHFEKKRNYNHPTGRMIPDIQIYHQLSGIPDISTNLTFERVSTQSFEIRCQSKIKLQDNGNVRRDGEEINQAIRRNRVGLAASANDTTDHNTSTITSQSVRIQKNLPLQQRFTPSQCEIIFDDNVSSRSFDRISEYNVRPPELKCFTLKDYFRFFRIDKHTQCKYTMSSNLDPDNIDRCLWYDGFSRQVRLRKGAIPHARSYVQSYLQQQQSIDAPTDDQLFSMKIHRSILNMLRIFSTNDDDLSSCEFTYKEEFHDNFIYDNKGAPLPIIVFSKVNPVNVNQWLVHILLSMGSYVCERDAFDHASMLECFRATKLIGPENDDASLRQYVDALTRRYIHEQVVYLPISLITAQHWIMRAYSILESVIIDDSTPIFELPYTIVELRDKTTDINDVYWLERKGKLLDAIYHELSGTSNIPSRQDILNCDRNSPLDWNPVDDFQIVESQNQRSYDEQKLALDLIYRSVLKYCGPLQGRRIDTYTKNPIIQGSPGSGKSHMGMHAMLFCLSQGLNVISTALMAARASVLGGIHLHTLFSLNVVRNRSFTKPMRLAELALEKIMKRPHLLYPLLTVNVIFLDEAGQVSAELLTTLDIILRTVRKCSIIYGGVLIIGTMDHCQLQPINSTPFLLSSHILTTYTFVQLNESVRASSQPEFQRFQTIIRMNPYQLSGDENLRQEFFRLGNDLFTFVDSWDDEHVVSNCYRIYSRRSFVYLAISEYVNSLIQSFTHSNTPHIISTSRDTQVRVGSRSEWSPAIPTTISSMNTQFREPEVLVLYPFGLYEVTENDSSSTYYNSNHVLLYDMPNPADVAQFRSIKVMLKPPELQRIDWLDSGDTNSYPSKQQLIDNGWKEISIKVCQEREVTVSGGYRAKRKQYTMKHIGASTIDNAQGKTVYTQLGFECSNLNSPWLKSQIVVVFSRTQRSQQMIIVGQRTFALQKIWDLITTPTQWTQTMDRILHMLSINSSGTLPENNLPTLPDVHPFRIRDMSIPTDSTGFVYLLCSMKDNGYTYIGQCDVLSTRLNQHNSGHGSFGTSDSTKYPLFVAGYITGLRHYNPAGRMALESHWRNAIVTE